MANRIVLTISKDVHQNTTASKFLLDTNKIRGLAEFEDGLVLVSFEAYDGAPISQVFVEESFEIISESVLYGDYENSKLIYNEHQLFS